MFYKYLGVLMNSKYVLFAMLMVVVGASAFGQSTIQINQSVRSSISIYIPNAIINGSTYYSMAYFGSNFIVMQTGNNYIVINGTAPYSIIANNKTITPLLRINYGKCQISKVLFE